MFAQDVEFCLVRPLSWFGQNLNAALCFMRKHATRICVRN
jgi:hypothetical protein